VVASIPPKIGSRSEPGGPEIMFRIIIVGYCKGNAALSIGGWGRKIYDQNDHSHMVNATTCNPLTYE
jgi:hypothetical protein